MEFMEKLQKQKDMRKPLILKPGTNGWTPEPPKISRVTLKNGKLFVIESVIVCAWVYLFRQAAAVPGVRFPGLLLPGNGKN